MRKGQLLVGLVLVAGWGIAGAACGGDTNASNCPPGRERCSCYGNGTCDEGLTCESNVCVDSGGGAAGGPDGSGGTAGDASVGGSGGSDRPCLPGQIERCTGPGDCPGIRECLDDGTGYGSCECAAGGSAGSAGTGGGGTGGGGTGGATGGVAGADPCDGPNPPPGCWVATTAACGDGEINMDPPEACDDGNTLPGDGCSGACVIEPNYVCPVAGQPCISTIVCGDGVRDFGEVCDDGNNVSSDGCSAACDMVEPGFECPVQGGACTLVAGCGDGVVTGNERCDDGNSVFGDGCSNNCQWELGWACSGQPGAYNCVPTICGDGVRGNAESCDDGNVNSGDGCSPMCENEPNCSAGACTTSCGDGLLLPGSGEQCDDGNGRDGDGCSSTCQQEAGFVCQQPPPGPTMTVPVVYRDFTSSHPNFEPGYDPPDDIVTGLVANQLGPDGKPVYTGGGQVYTDAANFSTWFNDNPQAIAVVETLTLNQIGADYVYENGAFFPLDGKGWVALGLETLQQAMRPPPYGNWEPAGSHNFYFTSEVRFWFEYTGNHMLDFFGDDDVWVFVNRQLAVDVGGIHSPKQGNITLNSTTAATYGLTVGNLYEVVVFHAERHTTCSTYKLTLSGFNTSASDCVSLCGDGIVAANEQCDDGSNTGAYGGCAPGCVLGPHCGDGVVQVSYEQCDDGLNDGGYGECWYGCVVGEFCGDGITNGPEQCDDGILAGGYGECAPGCVLGPFCGDGVLQEVWEHCDDGNNVSHDGCSSACVTEVRVQ